MKVCKGCGSTLYGRYCSQCGLKDKVERISFGYLLHELIHFFTHMEQGFFYTSKEMLVRPGQLVKRFISGIRNRYQSPLSYFLLWITIYLLSLYLVEKYFGENVVIDYKDYFGASGATKFAISHLGLVLTIVIPFQALYLLLLVTGKEYNYVESAVAVIYALGTVILLQFVFVIIALLVHFVSGAAIPLQLSDILKVGYLAWFIIDFSKLFEIKQRWIRILAFLILAFGTFTLWRLYGVPQLINWFLHK